MVTLHFLLGLAVEHQICSQLLKALALSHRMGDCFVMQDGCVHGGKFSNKILINVLS